MHFLLNSQHCLPSEQKKMQKFQWLDGYSFPTPTHHRWPGVGLRVAKWLYVKVTSQNRQEPGEKTKASIPGWGQGDVQPERTVTKVSFFRDKHWEVDPKSKTEQIWIEAPTIPELLNRWWNHLNGDLGVIFMGQLASRNSIYFKRWTGMPKAVWLSG